MHSSHSDDLETIKQLFDSQIHSILSTQQDGQPYASIVLFASTPDMDQLLFLTPDTTRKYHNLARNPKVAMLVSNNQNGPQDFKKSISVTSTGVAKTVSENEKQPLLKIYLDRHPHMEDFAGLSTTAMIRVAVDTHIMVSQFQKTTTIKVSP